MSLIVWSIPQVLSLEVGETQWLVKSRPLSHYSSPGPDHAIGRYPFAQVVDGRYDSIFQPHFGRLPAGLVGGGDEGQIAVGFVAFFLHHDDDNLIGLVIGFGPGQGAVVEDEGQVVHDNMDCSWVGGFLPDVAARRPLAA
jgi:hypothetical protein